MSTQPLRNLLTAIGVLSCSIILSAQISLKPKMSDGDIYAISIGISDYQDENIKDLKYAHQDAKTFVEYLSSPAGGNVPSENISLLTNEKATISNIYAAVKNVRNKAKKGDLVYFYFSGHGDVEEGLYSLGFFLAYDTPFKNYLTNAIRIEDINMMANSLSVKQDVKIILITDACHSGRISGQDNRGNQLIGEQLSKAEKNEVRLASCEPDQLSQEGEAWGNGRGVFSYYLLQGLMGMADAGKEDGIISLNEIKMYLEENIPDDVAKVKKVDQIPVIQGKGRSMMAVVDKELKSKLKENVDLQKNGDLASKGIYEPSAADQYFDNLTKADLYNNYDFSDWQNWKSKKIIKKALEAFENYESEKVKSSKWREKVEDDKQLKKEYGLKLAALLHNEVQPVVNDYVSGKPKPFKNTDELKVLMHEIERCHNMLNVAHKLLEEDDYLYKIVGTKKHWTKALWLRLSAPLSEDPDKTVKEAKQEVKKALEYEDRAKYVHMHMDYSRTVTTIPGETKTTQTIIRKKPAKRNRRRSN